MITPYIHNVETHNTKAAEVIVPLILEKTHAQSILDVGCGLGTWLKVFSDYGITDFIGLDGNYIDYTKLLIDRQQFIETNLCETFNLKRKFDITLCLEVAEHLPESSADLLVQSLCNHSDIIIFSAAIPDQGGQNHINEQWPCYWQEKFEKFGYYFHDTFRKIVWNEDEVDWWYKQNIFLIDRKPSNDPILNLVHPALFQEQLNGLNNSLKLYETGKIGIKESFLIFIRACRNFIKL